MGMNQPGEIRRLSQLTKPTVALIVNVRPVHLEKLGSLEAIRREKVSIAEGLPSNGVLVAPRGLDTHEWPGTTVRFGEDAEIRELDHIADGERWTVSAEVRSRRLAFSLTPGAPHRVLNALAALACIDAAGLDPAALAEHLESVGIMTGRGVEQTAGGITVIDDSFNGNPASMQAALDSLAVRPVQGGRRIAILGDMLELGDEAPRYHRELARHLDGIDAIYCVGPLMEHLYSLLPGGKALGWTDEASMLDPAAIAKLLNAGDVVVVKGSKKIFWVNRFVPRLVEALAKT